MQHLAPEYDKNGILIRNTNYGTSGASLSTEVDFSSILPYSIRRSGIGSYLFADAGVINIDDINRKNYITAMSDIRADVLELVSFTLIEIGDLLKNQNR